MTGAGPLLSLLCVRMIENQVGCKQPSQMTLECRNNINETNKTLSDAQRKQKSEGAGEPCEVVE